MKNFMQFAALLAASALIACPTPSTDDQNGVKVDTNTVTLLAGIDGYFTENGELKLKGIFKTVELLDPKPKIGLLDSKGSSGNFSGKKGPSVIIPTWQLFGGSNQTTNETSSTDSTTTDGLSVVNIDGKNYSPGDVINKIQGTNGETRVTETTTTENGTTTTIQNVTDDKGVTRRVTITDDENTTTRISYNGPDPDSDPTSLTIIVKPNLMTLDSKPLRNPNTIDPAASVTYTIPDAPANITVDDSGNVTNTGNQEVTVTVLRTITTENGTSVTTEHEVTVPPSRPQVVSSGSAGAIVSMSYSTTGVVPSGISVDSKTGDISGSGSGEFYLVKNGMSWHGGDDLRAWTSRRLVTVTNDGITLGPWETYSVDDDPPYSITVNPGTGVVLIPNDIETGTTTLTITETIPTVDGLVERKIPVKINVEPASETPAVPVSVTATIDTTRSVSIDTGIPGGSVTQGTLPSGFSIGTDGVITGTPETAGTSVVTISDGVSSTTVTIDVSDVPVDHSIVTVTEPSQGVSVTKTVTTYFTPYGSVTETTIATTSGGSTSTVTAVHEVEEIAGVTTTTATITNTDGSSKVTVTEEKAAESGTITKVTETEKNPAGTVIRETSETTTTVTNAGTVTKSTVRTGDNYWNPRTNSNDISDGGEVFFLSPSGSLHVASQSASPNSKLVNISGSCISDMRSNYKGGHRVFSVSRDSSGAVSEVSVTYTNGAEVPLPVNPAITLAPKYKTDPSDSSKLVQIPYARAELWYKILPAGSETSASVWHKAATVTGSSLTANTINAPIRLFGPISIPAASQGDSIIFLLYLVDEDGSASGEQPVEGEADPVVTPPDTKTVVIGSADSSAEFNGTAYTSPYLYRVVYNGKKALK